MAHDSNYEYINEDSIDPEFICIICGRPFSDPLSTPCDHTFCRKCITGSINAGNIGCPTCRQQPMLQNNLAPASRIVRKLLDDLLIKCRLCGETELKRGNFNKHISNECRKVCISCTSTDILCPWKGPRDQLDSHIQTCIFQSSRAILTDLITNNQQLEEQIKQQGAQIKQQNARMELLEDKLFSK